MLTGSIWTWTLYTSCHKVCSNVLDMQLLMLCPSRGDHGLGSWVGTFIKNKTLRSNFPTLGIRFQFKVPYLRIRFEFKVTHQNERFNTSEVKNMCFHLTINAATQSTFLRIQVCTSSPTKGLEWSWKRRARLGKDGCVMLTHFVHVRLLSLAKPIVLQSIDKSFS